MNFLNQCNGYRFVQFPFNEQARAKLKELLPAAREEFKTWAQTEEGRKVGSFDYWSGGGRFDDDESVELRINSVTNSEGFLADPLAWALDALRDCASADYYYNYEKDYGHD